MIMTMDPNSQVYKFMLQLAMDSLIYSGLSKKSYGSAATKKNQKKTIKLCCDMQKHDS